MMPFPDVGRWDEPPIAGQLSLNERAWRICEPYLEDPEAHGIAMTSCGGATLIDAGIASPGGLSAGVMLAKACTCGLMQIDLVPATVGAMGLPSVSVSTSRPLEACMAAQYAGWRILLDGYFAMGSGPMRAAAGNEALYEEIGCTESPARALGVLETSTVPTEAVVATVAEACGVPTECLRLLMAPTASLAGGVQVVARSVETAMHKLHELKFDLRRIVAGYGSAPVPPVACSDMAAIGRTNDAVLYGGRCTLYVKGDDASVEAVIDRVPASASPDYGEPFSAIFARYDHDFYRIDPNLFSPASVTMQNVDTGSTWHVGRFDHEVLETSFSA